MLPLADFLTNPNFPTKFSVGGGSPPVSFDTDLSYHFVILHILYRTHLLIFILDHGITRQKLR